MSEAKRIDINEVIELFKAGLLHQFKYNDGDTFIEIGMNHTVNSKQKTDELLQNLPSSNHDDTTENSLDDLAQQTPSENEGNVIKSEAVGIFYAGPKPEEPDFVSVGSKVHKGDVIGLVEAMKMFSEIKSPFDGTVTKILIANNEMVEFNQPLIIVDTQNK